MYRHTCTVCNWRTSLLNVWACASWGHERLCKSSCTECKWKASFLNGLECASWGYQLLWRSSCTVCKQKASLHCEPPCAFSDDQLWWLSSRTSIHFHFRCLHLLIQIFCFVMSTKGSRPKKISGKLGILSQRGGGGSRPIPSFLNQNHMVILLGFCHNKGGGVPQYQPFSPKKWDFFMKK